jgi:hypothetical protein
MCNIVDRSIDVKEVTAVVAHHCELAIRVGYVLDAPRYEVVYDDDFVTFFQPHFDQMRSDEACASSYDYTHYVFTS